MSGKKYLFSLQVAMPSWQLDLQDKEGFKGDVLARDVHLRFARAGMVREALHLDVIP